MRGKMKIFKWICFMISVPAFLFQADCGKVSLKNPAISGISPASGIVGTQVTINGDRFDTSTGNDVVKFNGVQATVISATTNQIVATVPAGATTGFITVTTSNGIAGSPTTFTVTQLFGGSVQGFTPSFSNTVSTVAGSAGNAGSADGVGSAARFNGPFGVTTDGFSIFITDRNNNTIRKMNIATGNVTTIAGSPGATGSVDGTGSAARFNSPTGITTDGTNLYVCDTLNHTIRQIVIATGQVTTIAGLAGQSGAINGVGSMARFNSPTGITTDNSNLYVCDTLNNLVRQISLIANDFGDVTTLAGSGQQGFANGTGAGASFNAPAGITITINGNNLFIADQNNNAIRTILLSNQQVTTIANTSGVAGFLDGSSGTALFNKPSGITTDGFNLYITDLNNQVIRTLIPSSSNLAQGQVFTNAGSPGNAGSANGVGTAALFNNPVGITNTNTSMFIADSANNTIRMLQ
jgi:hypothetical protein